MSSQHFTNYLNEIAKVPLLTQQEEIELGTIIQNKESSKTNLKSAVVRLVGANLRLVVKAAGYYRNSHHDIEELTFEGNKGLMTAAEKFDPNKGCRFSTYATWWIQQQIRLAVNAGHTIRTPLRRAAQIAKIQSSPSFDPDLDEQDTAKISNETNIPEEDVKKLLKCRTQLLPMDAPAPGADGSATLQCALPSDEAPADEQLIDAELREKLKDLLKKLPRVKRQVVQLRFGLNNQPAQTLEQIAAVMGRTRERIRKIQLEGIQMLQQEIQKLGYVISPSALLSLKKPSAKKTDAVVEKATQEGAKQTNPAQQTMSTVSLETRARISASLKARYERIRAAKAEAEVKSTAPSGITSVPTSKPLSETTPAPADDPVAAPISAATKEVAAEPARPATKREVSQETRARISAARRAYLARTRAASVADAEKTEPAVKTAQEAKPAPAIEVPAKPAKPVSNGTVSQEVRARISATLKARWERIRAGKAETAVDKPAPAPKPVQETTPLPSSQPAPEPLPAPTNVAVIESAKPASKVSKVSLETRARISATLKARWERIRAGKAETAVDKPAPAPKPVQETTPLPSSEPAPEPLPAPTNVAVIESAKPASKVRKVSPETRARISATLKARWERIRAGKAETAVDKPAPAPEPVQETTPPPSSEIPQEPLPAPTNVAVIESAKPASKVSKVSPETRARISATLKARWERIRAGKAETAANIPAPAHEPVQETTPPPSSETSQEPLPAPANVAVIESAKPACKVSKVSPETRARISATLKARWERIRAGKAETAANKPAPAPKPVQETTPPPISETAQEPLPASTSGVALKCKVSPELRSRISAHMKAYWARIRAALAKETAKSREEKPAAPASESKVSPETRARISAAMKAVYARPETRERLSIARKAYFANARAAMTEAAAKNAAPGELTPGPAGKSAQELLPASANGETTEPAFKDRVSKVSQETRARISATLKARWERIRAARAEADAQKPASANGDISKGAAIPQEVASAPLVADPCVTAPTPMPSDTNPAYLNAA